MGTAALFSGSWCVRKPVESKSSVDPMSFMYIYIYVYKYMYINIHIMLFHYFDFVLLFAIEFERYYIHRPYFRIGIYIYIVYLDLCMLSYIDSHISLYFHLCLCSNFYLQMRIIPPLHVRSIMFKRDWIYEERSQRCIGWAWTAWTLTWTFSVFQPLKHKKHRDAPSSKS